MLLTAAELESPKERGLDALKGPFGRCSNVLNRPVLNTGSNSTGERQLLERKKKRPCATLGCTDDSDDPGCASSSAAYPYISTAKPLRTHFSPFQVL